MRRYLSFIFLFAFSIPVYANGMDPTQFASPPDEDRPWVYWFWKNGNITREGITADLESMERVGIGGLILMEVSLSVPSGPVTFFSDTWRGLFKHAVEEAHRLGISISMNSAPGWTGSGGPWVTPEQSMQKVVFGEVQTAGPAQFDAPLPQPEAFEGFYKDIAVLAFPTVSGVARIGDIDEKAFYRRGAFSSQPAVRASLPSPAEYEEAPSDSVVPLDAILDITSQMSSDGRLLWEVPAGNWTILRIGHTSTGQTNRPAPLPGLECDKLDRVALEDHFDHFIDILLAEIGPDAREALVAVHLDSWEVGAQNWSRHFRESFQERRGYDLLPYLPVLTGRIVATVEISERFLWDLRQTISDLIVSNHGLHLRELAHERGLWFSVEPYDMTPCADLNLGATGDVAMCEFWSKGFDTRYSVTEATSVAHVYNKPIVAAEAFTSIDRWLLHPGSIKAQGDWAFCSGVNRLVIHRYVHQPYSSARPGLSLGPHGLHYERTQTWWEYTRPWHDYLARCQHMLRLGRHVSDILYLNPEGAPNVFLSPDPAPLGYKFDACSPEALLTLAKAEDSQIVFPGGMRYRMLVLPHTDTMTPELLARICDFADAGVPILGSPPIKSPSLSGYPACDAQVEELASQLWPDLATQGNQRVRNVTFAEGKSQTSPRYEKRDALGQSQWIWYPEADVTLPAPPGKRYFRREFALPENSTLRSAQVVMTADNSFVLYVNGMEAASGDNLNEIYSIDVAPFVLPGSNILAVLAENKGNQPNAAGVVCAFDALFEDGQSIRINTDETWSTSADAHPLWTQKADQADWLSARSLGTFGIAPWEDVGKTAARVDPYPDSRIVEETLQGLSIPCDFDSTHRLEYVHRQFESDDIYFISNPTPNPVSAECRFRVSAHSAALWHPESGKIRDLTPYLGRKVGMTVLELHFEATESYFVVFKRTAESSEKPFETPTRGTAFPAFRTVSQISGPWDVFFETGDGKTGFSTRLEELTDWSSGTESDIKYFSGSAVYTKDFPIPDHLAVPDRSLFLDLGRVEILASVSVNGEEMGIAWKTPFRVDITRGVKPGMNRLEVRVANLWPNRMIGDALLPSDSERHANGTLKEWPTWVLEGKTSPTGRHSFATWQHWTAEDALLPSGLLGPVTLLVQEP
ncbi:MAG: hypothetical protein AMXMBFR84_45060 [Candidatus Hydrogenedentota bacterium]